MRHAIHHTASLMAPLLTWLCCVSTAYAQNINVRTTTIAQAYNQSRSDSTLAPTRLFGQRLTLRAWDALGHNDGAVSAHLMFDYATDMGLERPWRIDPRFSQQYNALGLNLAYIQWRPAPRVDLSIGRLWLWNQLGPAHLDGGQASWTPYIGHGLHATMQVWGGRVVNDQQGWLGQTMVDLQGLPVQETFTASGSWQFGARAGLKLADTLHLNTSYTRRVAQSREQSALLVQDERLGAAISWAPHTRINAQTSASYHMVLQRLVTARADVAWQLPGLSSAFLTFGAARQTPWFDTTSIFNLFDPKPYDDLYVQAQTSPEGWETLFEVRGWHRSFHADDDTLDFGAGKDDAHATGVGISHATRARWGSWPVQWRSNLSVQWGEDETIGDQVVLDTSIKQPSGISDLMVTTRAMLLGLWREGATPNAQYAATGVLGLEYALFERGSLSAYIEQHMPTASPWRTVVYGSLSVELWP